MWAPAHHGPQTVDYDLGTEEGSTFHGSSPSATLGCEVVGIYTYEILFRSTTEHSNVDGLSRTVLILIGTINVQCESVGQFAGDSDTPSNCYVH
jgi:hypothetical protein